MVVALKKQFPELATSRIGYAGRLDPMAEGLLLLLVGDENKQRVSYEKLAKVYSVELLFGFATDSHDILGLITDQDAHSLAKNLHVTLEKTLTTLIGTHE